VTLIGESAFDGHGAERQTLVREKRPCRLQTTPPPIFADRHTVPGAKRTSNERTVTPGPRREIVERVLRAVAVCQSRADVVEPRRYCVRRFARRAANHGEQRQRALFDFTRRRER